MNQNPSKFDESQLLPVVVAKVLLMKFLRTHFHFSHFYLINNDMVGSTVRFNTFDVGLKKLLEMESSLTCHFEILE